VSNEVTDIVDATAIADAVTGQVTRSKEPDALDPKDSKDYTFEFSYTDPRGGRWEGTFANKILTIGQQRQVKIIKAKLAGGVSVESQDASVWQMNEMIAHLLVSLDRKAPGFPSWAGELDKLYDEQIVYKLYAEVASHENRFWRRDSNQEGVASSV